MALKGHVPDLVAWDQTSILREIAALKGAMTALTNLTGNPASDARGTVVREVTAERLIQTLEGIHEQIRITNMHLSIMTEQHFEIGD